jgi:hypothetical protein
MLQILHFLSDTAIKIRRKSIPRKLLPRQGLDHPKTIILQLKTALILPLREKDAVKNRAPLRVARVLMTDVRAEKRIFLGRGRPKKNTRARDFLE